jgi:hypothetical protein
MEEKLTVLRTKLREAISLLKEAVEISLEMKAAGTVAEREANGLWSLFLQEFLAYVKKRSRETKQNFLAGIRLPR